ncbi:MAG: hypothetical protein ACKOAU_21860 [Pirellula sp.]
MTDALRFLLPLVDTESLLIRQEHTCRWPEDVLQRLLDAGFLQVTNDAATIRCPECGEHTEEVYCQESDAGPPRFYIHCPVTWRVEIAPDARRQWRVSVPNLVETVSQTMNLKGSPKELLAGRLWRMGRTLWNGTSRDVVFARGLLWNDSQQVRSAIARCSKPILITSRQLKTKIPWRNAPLALSLDLIASMLDRFNLDVDEIIAILAERSDNPDKSAIEVPTAEDLKLLVRRQIKAEQKTELTDAVLVQAYLQEGSIRKAAEFLTSQTGHFISKDKVQRAVQRSGGIDSLVDGKDSNSIVRGVASQCRDSRGNLLIKEIPAN